MKRKKTKEKEAAQRGQVARLPREVAQGGVLAVAVCLPGQAPVIEWGPLLAALRQSRRDS